MQGTTSCPVCGSHVRDGENCDRCGPVVRDAESRKASSNPKRRGDKRKSWGARKITRHGKKR